MNGFEKRKERKKSNIINTAFRLFSKYGVKKVSIQEIAQQAQVSQVTIYNYFGGKDQLLFEAVKKFTSDQLFQFQEVTQDPEKDFQDKINLIIRNKSESILQLDPDFLQSIMEDQPEIQSFITRFTEECTIPLLMEFVEQGKKEGYVHPDISFRAIMFHIKTYYQALRSSPVVYGNTEEIQQISEELTHMFFYGLMGNKEQRIQE